MAIFSGSVFSKSLSMMTDLTVCLPNDTHTRPAGGFPTLFLLHGYSDNHTVWTRRTNIDRYAEERGIAVVMPEVQHSFYADMKYGMNYFRWVSDELPRLAREMFALSVRREETFVAGLSMGGYGALKCALRRPDVFSACASLSGATDIRAIVENFHAQDGADEMKAILGTDLQVSDSDDLFLLADKAALLPAAVRPAVMTCCGTEDFLYEHNLRFRDHMKKTGMHYEYAEGPGSHEWSYWEEMIRPVLDFFLKNTK